tara:strand:- start:185 stop:340 length:156 start_codon:yes stop_codon:yes gene_type:complete
MERFEFIEYWVDYIKKNPDEVWSKQQNLMINSMLKTAKQFSRKEYLELKES